jgi:chitodextrinase
MTTVTVSASVLNYVITGLSEGTSYNIQVQALNSDVETGLSPGNSILYAKTTLSGQPSDPYGIALAEPSTCNSMLLTWQDASANGGTNISGYNISWRPADGDGSATTNLSQYTVENLVEGSRYTFTITATNTSGDSSPGLAKFSASTNPENARQDPDGFSLGSPAGPNSIGLQWNANGPPGGALTTGLSAYAITWQPPDGGGIVYASCNAYSTVVTGLSANTQYVFNIYTVGTDGGIIVNSPGNFYVTGTTTEEGGLLAPSGFELVNGSVTTSSAGFIWEAARVSDPGDYILFYTIQATDGSSGYTITQSTEEGTGNEPPLTELTFTNLSANTEYLFSLTATSDFSLTVSCTDPESISVITDGSNKPSDPKFVIVEGEVTTYSVLLNWSAALTNGGANISSYTITWADRLGDGGTATTLANVRSYRATGLSPFTGYNFTITARNLSGFVSSGQNGSYAGTANVNGPRDPTGFMLSEYISTTSSSISVVWESAPRNGGTRIASYILNVKGGEIDSNYQLPTPVNAYTITGLEPKSDYTLGITAENEEGLNSPGNWWTYFTAATAIDGEPGDPGFLRSASPPADTDDSIGITWNTASTNGGSDISAYEVTWTPQ